MRIVGDSQGLIAALIAKGVLTRCVTPDAPPPRRPFGGRSPGRLLQKGRCHNERRRGAAAPLDVAAGRSVEFPQSWRLHDAGRGRRCIVVDELWARALCAVEHLELASAFNGTLNPGEMRCLVLTPEGGLVVPAMLATSRPSRGVAN